MMKLLFFMLFLIPLVSNWWLVMNCILFLSIIILCFPLSYYYSLLSYGYGMDVFSYWMIFLTVWIIFLMLLASFKVKQEENYSVEFIFVNIFLLLMLFFSFSTDNMFMFYLYFESSMIPTLFLIFGWGYQPERLLAGFYLLFYTLFASLPLFICLFYIYNFSGTLFYFLVSFNCNFYIYVSLILAFLVKMPMVFVHFWLPKAHVEAPVSGSMILAGVLLKLGGYGLYRVFYFIYDYAVMYNYLFVVLSSFGSVIVGLLCLCQFDIKSMIAYSSVSHMGLVICGIFSLNMCGVYGSLVLMLGHGLCSSALFALANIIYERSGSRSLFINSGFIVFMPSLSLFWFIFSVNNMASPPSLNLLGEVYLINSMMSWSTFLFVFIGLSSFLSCCYSIYLFSIIQHGSVYSGLFLSCGGVLREYLMLFFHFLPLNLFLFGGNMFIFYI
uniref:NADH-ubiquinone oxidoreductase chain 4 n=1 Tax=Dinomachus sikhimensis TaxID=2813434 RepID=A0A8T9ZWT2_9HEMI|nr:NADH dehydrogenase subunit 4 [Dinomachus sikhimensis]